MKKPYEMSDIEAVVRELEKAGYTASIHPWSDADSPEGPNVAVQFLKDGVLSECNFSLVHVSGKLPSDPSKIARYLLLETELIKLKQEAQDEASVASDC